MGYDLMRSTQAKIKSFFLAINPKPLFSVLIESLSFFRFKSISYSFKNLKIKLMS